MKARKKLFKMLFAVALSLLFISGGKITVNAEVAGRETLQINETLSFTGLGTPGYTFESSMLSKQETVGVMVFNISIDLPTEGDPSWNDWCGEALAVRAGDTTKYYDFGGAQVSWGVDFDGDENADTGGVGSESWIGTAANGTCTVVVPVNAAEFAIDFYDNCWENATDIPHYTINSATAVYGSVEATEQVAVGQEITFTGAGDPAYTFSNSNLSTSGNVAAVAFNISIALPAEGDPSWNDWCGQLAAVKAGDTVKYYDFGGAQVGWGVDMDGDDNADTGGVGTESWVGTAENGSLSIVVPVNAEEFTINLYDNCWESATDVTHLVINSATAIFGSVAGGTEEPVEETPEEVEVVPETPVFDPNGVYKAYLGIQTQNYIFRNAWADESFGANGTSWEKNDIGNNFNGLTGWDGADAVKYDGTFTDVEIKGNGTYRVSLTDFDFGGDESLNLLFLSTDIPIEGNHVSFTNVKVILNGSTKYTFENGVIPGIDSRDDKEYYEVHCINIWNTEQLGGKDGLFGYVMPNKSVEIEFTVSGFAYDKVEEPVEEPVEEVVEEDKEEPVEEVEDEPVETVSEDVEEAAEDKDTNWLLIAGIVVAVIVIAVVVVLVIKNKGKESQE